MHANASQSADYWPGYVDALINVVLNLLFVVSIFCVALFAAGLQSAHQTPRPSKTASQTADLARPSPVPAVPATTTPPAQLRQTLTARSQPATSPDAGTDAPTPVAAAPLADLPALMLTVHASSVAPTAASIQVAEHAREDGAWQVELDYPHGATALDEPAARMLAQLTSPQAHGGPLLVQASTDLEKSGARRATYLRLMTVREALIAAGRDPGQVEVRMTGGGTWPEVGQAEVRIESAPPVAGVVAAPR